MKHSELVSALAKDGAEILQSLTPEKCHLLHMAVGISGEASELLGANVDDMDNIIEELGDIEFYLEGLCQGLCTPVIALPVGKVKRKNSIRKLIQVIAGDVLDTVKKHVIYNKDLPQFELDGLICRLFTSLNDAYVTFKLTREQVLNANIEKLSVRYTGLTYSDKAAQERADKVGE